MTRRVRVWGPAWVTMVLIFVLSSISGLGPIPGGVDDGVAHALQYAVLAALLLRGLAGARWRGVGVRVAALAVLLATLYGVTDEAHQWFVPGRTAEVTDLVADALGAAVAAGVICGWSIVRRS
ncbi:MAG: VanZ family protein [Acidobacteriota bacterium]|nr:VanZ family protein [Acidobacteriota bacterium]